jgi:hypothetical protein
LIRYKPPKQPPGFAAAIRKARQANGSKGKGATQEFKAIWGKFKHHFIEAQHSKCGYCEANTQITGFGEVEHYYPKAEVKLHLVVGGKKKLVVLYSPGFSWLAFAWRTTCWRAAAATTTSAISFRSRSSVPSAPRFRRDLRLAAGPRFPCCSTPTTAAVRIPQGIFDTTIWGR